jgi:hypothetical protein
MVQEPNLATVIFFRVLATRRLDTAVEQRTSRPTSFRQDGEIYQRVLSPTRQ